MKPFPHQIAIADEGFKVLKEHGLVYLGMEERTMKTLITILIAEMSTRMNILVLTKKKALMGDGEKKADTATGGWYGTLNSYGTKTGKVTWTTGDTSFTVINYHGIHSRYQTPKGKTAYRLNYKPSDYDLIILDESHSYLSAYPKVGAIWKSVKKFCIGQPLILLSATPNAQGYQLLYNQLRLSDWSPFSAYANFYRWFERYGIPDKVRTSYGLQETYKKSKPEVWDAVKHLFITYTRAELGFKYEPEDKIHYFELSEVSKKQYNDCIETEMFMFTSKDGDPIVSPLDSSMKLRTTMHMIEGGVTKVDDDYFILDQADKARAIFDDFGDDADNYIMYQYKAEGQKLAQIFKKTRLLQGTSYAEGVDLSMYKHGIIYSQDFSTARHSQRRARQANMHRDSPIIVHFYLVKGAISEQVYKTVSLNKENFVDALFIKETL